MKIPKINIVLSTLLLAVFARPVLANCQDIPAAPAALNKAVLSNIDIELLRPELDAFLVQLGSLRDCIRAQSDALKPPEITPTLSEGQEPAIDPKFADASQALSDATLLVDQLEENSISRFNYLVENAQADRQPLNPSNTTQP